ncbi:MAG: DUF362 domain-containing protein [Chloroflexota bacterium]
MPSTVYYGSPRQARLEAKETLPAKLDLILERLNLRDRVKDERVCIKLHVGNGIGYSTIHPIFVRKVVQAIQDGGGKPFIVDVDWDVEGCEARGYTMEVLGCPVYPAAGVDEKYFYAHERTFKNIQQWLVAGMVQDASFLVNFAHIKGHPSCGYAGAIKNIALGCVAGPTRSAMHDTVQFDSYWFPENCPDEATRQKIKDACPFEALVDDKERPGYLHLHPEPCNACGRCLQVAPVGALKIDAINFNAFMEACAISTAVTMSTFEAGKAVHLGLATHMTPVCDCFGFTSMPILPDAGIFGSDDIVALDQAIIDATAKTPLIEDNIPTSMEVHTRRGHPLAWLHGPLKDPYMVTAFAEQYDLGSRAYDLVDVFPLEKLERAGMGYIPAS